MNDVSTATLDITPQFALERLTVVASWIVALELVIKERIPLAKHREAQEEVRRIRGMIARDPMLIRQALRAAAWILSRSDECADALAHEHPPTARWLQVVPTPEECKS